MAPPMQEFDFGAPIDQHSSPHVEMMIAQASMFLRGIANTARKAAATEAMANDAFNQLRGMQSAMQHPGRKRGGANRHG